MTTTKRRKPGAKAIEAKCREFSSLVMAYVDSLPGAVRLPDEDIVLEGFIPHAEWHIPTRYGQLWIGTDSWPCGILFGVYSRFLEERTDQVKPAQFDHRDNYRPFKLQAELLGANPYSGKWNFDADFNNTPELTLEHFKLHLSSVLLPEAK